MSDKLYENYAIFQTTWKGVHAETLLLLCSELARKRGLPPFSELLANSRARILCDATKMCAAWSADEALRESYIPGKSAIVDLVAVLHRMADECAIAEHKGTPGDECE